MYAHILLAYSFWNYQDFIALQKWDTLNINMAIYEKNNIETLRYFLENTNILLGDYAKMVDKAIVHMRKQIARKKSQQSADNNIKQLYNLKMSVWDLGTRGRDKI